MSTPNSDQQRKLSPSVWQDGGIVPARRVPGLRFGKTVSGGGKVRYRVTNTYTNVKRVVASREEAVGIYNEMTRALHREGSNFDLTPSERAAIALWRNHRRARIVADKESMTLEKAIQFAIMHENAQDEASPLIAEVMHEYINSLERAGRDEGYVTTTCSRLELMLAFFPEEARLADVDDKTAVDCLAYARDVAGKKNGKPISAATMKQYAGCITAMWAWCEKMRKVDDNPFTRAQSAVNVTSRATLKRPGKEYTDRQSLERMLNWTREHHPQMLACLVLIAFCGLRPSEAHRLQWRHVVIESAEKGAVHLTAIKTKTDKSRMVTLCPAAIAWLQLANELADSPDAAAYIVPEGGDDAKGESTRKEMWSTLVGQFKANCPPNVLPQAGEDAWPRDLLRHSYGTYYRAKTGSLAQTAEQMGNTESVCRQHYSSPVAQKEGAEYFEIYPAPSSCGRGH